MIRSTVPVRFAVGLLIVLIVILLRPRNILAGPANDMCHPVKQECFCGMFKDPKKGCVIPGNKFQCFCTETNNGFTTSGVCVSEGICSTKSTEGQNGMPMLPMMMPPMDMPMMPMDCNSGFGGTSGIDKGTTTSSTSSQACPNAYTQSSYGDFNYNNNTGDNTNTTDFTPSSTTISDLIDTTSNNNGSPTKFAVASTSGGNTTFVGGQVFGLTGGISGDLKIIGTAVTAFVSNRDAVNNAQVSGFYGRSAPTQAAAVQVVTMMCRTRPWASNFLSFIVPATFFDSICTLRGFPVGQPAAKGGSKTTGVGGKSKTTPPPPPPYVKPKVDVWAVPESVRSGFRASIFWQASGVKSCTIASADGLFSESSLSGHAASAPLTNATTFTMTCETATSSPVVDRVTVNVI